MVESFWVKYEYDCSNKFFIYNNFMVGVKMINKIIEDLKKEIEELEERRKELELSDDLIHAPDILQGVYYQLNWKKAKLQAYEDAQRIICGEIKKCKIHTMGNLILIEEDELLKKFQGESNE